MAKQSGEGERFAILLEEMRHEFSMLAEGLVSLDQTVDRRVNELSRTMDTGFQDVHTIIGTLSKEVSTLSKDVTGLSREFGTLSNQFQHHEQAHIR